MQYRFLKVSAFDTESFRTEQLLSTTPPSRQCHFDLNTKGHMAAVDAGMFIKEHGGEVLESYSGRIVFRDPATAETIVLIAGDMLFLRPFEGMGRETFHNGHTLSDNESEEERERELLKRLNQELLDKLAAASEVYETYTRNRLERGVEHTELSALEKRLIKAMGKLTNRVLDSLDDNDD